MATRTSQIGKDFSELFNVKRGDLMYGLREQRDIYRYHFDAMTKTTLGSDEWWTMDQYNNTYGIQILMDKAMLDGTVQADQANQAIPSSNTRVMHTDMLKKMMGTPNRNLYKILDEFDRDGEAMILYQGQVWDSGTDPTIMKMKAQSDRSIRKACKFGLEYVADVHKNNGSCIHFLLDGLDMDKVINKNKVTIYRTGTDKIERVFVPITYTELRNVYRKWLTDGFNQAIYFYRNFEHVRAPWEENPAAWRQYAQTRHAKLSNEL